MAQSLTVELPPSFVVIKRSNLTPTDAVRRSPPPSRRTVLISLDRAARSQRRSAANSTGVPFETLPATRSASQFVSRMHP